MGRDIAPSKEELFAKYKDSDPDPTIAHENALRAVTEAGIIQLSNIVASCATGGKPWQVVQVTTNERKLMADAELVKAYYAAGPRVR